MQYMQAKFTNMFFWLSILLACILDTQAFFDPVSIGFGVGAWGYSFFKDQTFCRMKECCTERYIPGNISDLEIKLRTKLYGQHIVEKQLIAALKAHFSSNSSRKPLVISFHGTPGTGKNFVADMMAEALYTNGLKSKFVHKYLGRADFALSSETDVYKERIHREVHEGIADCPRSLFIFDEVDKMPSGIFESLASVLDYHQFYKGHDYTKAIFIFLANTAGVQISDHLGNLIKKGTLREETKLNDFEQILEIAAYNMDGGMQKTSLIETHVIDHYLPFLPLEKAHVIKCTEAEFRRWSKVPSEKDIEKIVKDVVTYDRTHGLFATSGCKSLEKKVAVEVMISKDVGW